MKKTANILVAAAFAVPALCAVSSAAETSLSKDFPAGSVKSVKFNSVSASVSVEKSTGPVQITLSGFDPEKCEFETEMVGSELKISLKPKQKKALFSSRSLDCRAGASLLAPAGTGLDVRTVSGEISVNGFSAPVRLGTVSGEARAENLSGQLVWSSVSGDLSGSISGPVELSSTSGDASLRWLSAPEKLEFKSVSGSGKFVLPKGTSVSAKFSGVSGKLRNSLPEGAGVDVRLKTVSGDVELSPAP